MLTAPSLHHPHPAVIISIISRAFHTGLRQAEASKSRLFSLLDLVYGWASNTEYACSPPVQQILHQSRKESTRMCYRVKWHHFLEWAHRHHYSLDMMTISAILDYLLALKTLVLGLSSFSVHLAALSAFLPPVVGCSIFTCPTII